MQLFLTDSAQMTRFVGLIYPGLTIHVATDYGHPMKALIKDI